MRLSVRTGAKCAIILTVTGVVGCRGQSNNTPPATPKELAVKGTYTHEASGQQFPEDAAGFRRGKVHQYDAGGRVVSVGYDLEESRRLIAATVYLRPLPSPSFAEELNAVERTHAHFVLAFDQETTLERNGHTFPCRLAGFSYEDSFAGRYGPVSSYLLICNTVSWRVKWRFTHLPTDDPAISGVMKTLANTLSVPQ